MIIIFLFYYEGLIHQVLHDFSNEIIKLHPKNQKHMSLRDINHHMDGHINLKIPEFKKSPNQVVNLLVK